MASTQETLPFGQSPARARSFRSMGIVSGPDEGTWNPPSSRLPWCRLGKGLSAIPETLLDYAQRSNQAREDGGFQFLLWARHNSHRPEERARAGDCPNGESSWVDAIVAQRWNCRRISAAIAALNGCPRERDVLPDAAKGDDSAVGRPRFATRLSAADVHTSVQEFNQSVLRGIARRAEGHALNAARSTHLVFRCHICMQSKSSATTSRWAREIVSTHANLILMQAVCSLLSVAACSQKYWKDLRNGWYCRGLTP